MKMMVEMMRGVIDQGTGRALRAVYGINCDLAGKTGTTQDNTDGWFIGYTPTLVAGAWVGNDIPAIHFRSTALGQGAHTALPIFGRFLRKAKGDARFNRYTKVQFDSLPEYMAEKFNCELYSLQNPEKNFIEKIFDKPGKPDAQALKNPTETKGKTDKDKQSLLNRMKDLFKK